MIIDIKTGGWESWHQYQTAAYDHASEGLPIAFDWSLHRYELAGMELPSVTKILFTRGLISPWSLRDNFARDRGAAVHQACALLPDRLDWSSVDPRCFLYVCSFAEWLDQTKFVIEAQEQIVCNAAYGYAGTYDLKGYLPFGYNPTRAALYLQRDGSIAKVRIHDSPADWPYFKKLLSDYRGENEWTRLS